MKRKKIFIFIALCFAITLATLSGCASAPARAFGTQEGLASYYGKEFHGKKTSSGDVFDENLLTAAHRSFPLGSRVIVTNLTNGKQVEVTINDRGPVKPERIIDLSLGAAKEIDLVRSGLARVRIEVLEWGNGEKKAK